MKAIVFDMDGVLFDTERVYFEAWDKVAAEMNLDITEVLPLCAGHNNADITAIFNNYFGGKAFYEEFGPRKNQAFHDILKERGLPEKEGLHEIMEFLKANGYAIALATSTRREAAESHLRQAGILHCFDALATGDMFTHGKPDPEIYLTACRLLGSDPVQTYAVEDSYVGLESAHRAGMRPIMIPDQFPPTEYTSSIALTLPSLNALREWLAEKE